MGQATEYGRGDGLGRERALLRGWLAEITINDLRQLRVLRFIPTPPGPVRVCRHGERLLATSYHGCGLLTVELKDLTKQHVVSLPANALSLGYHAPSRTAVLSCHDQRVYLVDTVAGAVKRSIATRSDPDPVAVLRLEVDGRKAEPACGPAGGCGGQQETGKTTTTRSRAASRFVVVGAPGIRAIRTASVGTRGRSRGRT